VEIEAIDEEGIRTNEELLAQCQHYLKLFEIEEEDLIAVSYSDLILELQN
jgi:adenylate cyclase class IV